MQIDSKQIICFGTKQSGAGVNAPKVFCFSLRPRLAETTFCAFKPKQKGFLALTAVILYIHPCLGLFRRRLDSFDNNFYRQESKDTASLSYHWLF